ncbi:MAG TPA: thiopeptide-type bacteriocin biosynthesis protein [Actinospica sp.]|nr:thiopeptide-type bacteriocin biosynthesis protein [Actinospica sp.]
MDVVRLLADCLEDARSTPLGAVALPADDASSYAAARRRFLTGGLNAVREGLPEKLPEQGWVQLSMKVGDFAWPQLYSRLADTARELLGSGLARDFFFMHKPPGLRVRFCAQDRGRVPELRVRSAARLDPGEAGEPGWSRPVAGVYEPETYLFGGAVSMDYVHRLFTADSLAWLDRFATPNSTLDSTPDSATDRAMREESASGGWRVSLVLLRALLDGLGVVGWEDRGVWQVVREEAGRRLAGGLSDPQARRAAAGIRGYWRQPASAQIDAFPAALRPLLRGRRDEVCRAAQAWRAGYFESGRPEVGPRRAAAHCVVFHWNRGRFTAARQRLLTEALLTAEGD